MKPEDANAQAYHGIIVDASLRNQTSLKKFKIVSSKKDEDWTLYKVEIANDKIESVIELLKAELNPKFYAHFYRNNELIVVLKDAVFKTTINATDWKKIIDYGAKNGIAREQLDFTPCRIQDETW